MSLRHAIMINNEGVRLLDSDDIAGALPIFQRGVVILVALANEARATAPDELAAQSSMVKQSGRPAFSLHTGNKFVGLQDDGIGYVFDRPLLIPIEYPTSTKKAMYVDILSSMVVISFNFALACHQIGKMHGDGDTLSRAAELYRLTLVILRRMETSSDTMHSVMQCLVLNNLAQLYYGNCEFIESQYCLQCLFEIILWTGCLDDDDVDMSFGEIKLNLMYMCRPLTAGAA